MDQLDKDNFEVYINLLFLKLRNPDLTKEEKSEIYLQIDEAQNRYLDRLFGLR